MEIKVERMYLDGLVKLLQFISDNYDWNKKLHPVHIAGTESIGLTDEYKGNKEHKHQIFKGIVLQVRDDITEEKKSELKKIIESMD